MAYTSFPFPPSTFLFPPAKTVQTYLESFASHFDLRKHIQFNTSVDAATWNASIQKWKIRLSSGVEQEFDWVVVANGHYQVPLYPKVPGLLSWLSSKRAFHSAWYRHPINLGNTVLVVGGGPSGQDISTEIRSCAQVLIHSRTGGADSDSDKDGFKVRGRVLEFKEDGVVLFEGGVIETGIDHCILATGYQMSFPFLTSTIQTGIPPPCPPLPEDVFCSHHSIFPLSRHIFPVQTNFPMGSLVFMGLQRMSFPFPVFEAQAHAIVKSWADPGSLDLNRESADVLNRYEVLRERCKPASPSKIAKMWHLFVDQEQFDYRDALADFSGSGYVVKDWERDVLRTQFVMRKMWQELEESGEAEDWVRGVGERGVEEWVELMKRVVERATSNTQRIRNLKARL